jgi:hypothetical protein
MYFPDIRKLRALFDQQFMVYADLTLLTILNLFVSIRSYTAFTEPLELFSMGRIPYSHSPLPTASNTL